METLDLNVAIQVNRFSKHEASFRFLVSTNGFPRATRNVLVQADDRRARVTVHPSASQLFVYCMAELPALAGARSRQPVGVAQFELRELARGGKVTTELLDVSTTHTTFSKGAVTLSLTAPTTIEFAKVDKERERALGAWSRQRVDEAAYWFDNLEPIHPFLTALHSYYYNAPTRTCLPGFMHVLSDFSQPIGSEFFERALLLALDWHRLTADQFVKIDATNPKAQQVVVDAMALTASMSCYADDYLYDPSGKRLETDTWVSLVLTLAGDCEDMADQIVKVSMALQMLAKPHNELVRRAQAISRHFVPCRLLCSAQAGRASSTTTAPQLLAENGRSLTGHYTALWIPVHKFADLMGRGATELLDRERKRNGNERATQLQAALEFLRAQPQSKGDRTWLLEGTNYSDSLHTGTHGTSVSERAAGPMVRWRRQVLRAVGDHERLAWVLGETENGSFFNGHSVSVLTPFFAKRAPSLTHVPLEFAFFSSPSRYGVHTFDVFRDTLGGAFLWPNSVASPETLAVITKLLRDEPPVPSPDAADEKNEFTDIDGLPEIPRCEVPFDASPTTVVADWYLHVDHAHADPTLLRRAVDTMMSQKLCRSYVVELQTLGLQKRYRIRCTPILPRDEQLATGPRVKAVPQRLTPYTVVYRHQEVKFFQGNSDNNPDENPELEYAPSDEEKKLESKVQQRVIAAAGQAPATEPLPTLAEILARQEAADAKAAEAKAAAAEVKAKFDADAAAQAAADAEALVVDPDTEFFQGNSDDRPDEFTDARASIKLLAEHEREVAWAKGIQAAAPELSAALCARRASSSKRDGRFRLPAVDTRQIVRRPDWRTVSDEVFAGYVRGTLVDARWDHLVMPTFARGGVVLITGAWAPSRTQRAIFASLWETAFHGIHQIVEPFQGALRLVSIPDERQIVGELGAETFVKLGAVFVPLRTLDEWAHRTHGERDGPALLHAVAGIAPVSSSAALLLPMKLRSPAAVSGVAALVRRAVSHARDGALVRVVWCRHRRGVAPTWRARQRVAQQPPAGLARDASPPRRALGAPVPALRQLGDGDAHRRQSRLSLAQSVL